ncbi:MAG TPA: BON domain-containing protein, partial [Stellaceae bacterium]|nr:BON domain-containing protein [Stellaceae bacterium]
PTPPAKFQAEQIARQTDGVTAVFNEIQVAPNADAMDIAKDDWITARVRSELVFDGDIRSSNYTIETDRQSVYLLGSARSQGELDKATQHARYVPGVQRVVSYVDVRYGDPSAAPTAAAAPAARPPMASSNMGSTGMTTYGPRPSSAPIQVQKLN